MVTPLHTVSSQAIDPEILAHARLRGDLLAILEDLDFAAEDFASDTRETPLSGIERN